jgi:hypothetical protein
LVESIESWDTKRLSEDSERRYEALLCLNQWYEREDNKLLVNGAYEFLPLFAHSHAHAMIYVYI